MSDYHRRFLVLVDQIETTFPVADWRAGDVPLWPLARTAVYSNICEEMLGVGGAAGHAARQVLRPSARIARAAAYAATPLTNIWRNRSDLRKTVLRPHAASALFLGDGTSLDFIGGAWRDRFCEPLIAYLEANGRSSLLMQRGDLYPHPPFRPTLSANTVINWGHLRSAGLRSVARLPVTLPAHRDVLDVLSRNGVPHFGLDAGALRGRAAAISATARGFEKLLKRVKPSLCFMLTYYQGMGHALALACRRQGVLSVELQREGRGAQHEAYVWSAVPRQGYTILPAVFWTWTGTDASAIDDWTSTLTPKWHRSIHGGHTQLAPWFDDSNPLTRETDAAINRVRAGEPAEREILVALQAVGGHENEWNALASFIESGPSQWRWWLRRHPSTLQMGDHGLGRLPALRRPNVVIDLPSSVPLPGLLRHMDALVSATSGAAVEASLFGVRPFFLSPIARDLHPLLIENGEAEIVADMNGLAERIRGLSSGTTRRRTPQLPLSETFSRLNEMAQDYRDLCK